MITTNHVRENFRSGKVSVGCQLRTRSGLIAELYGLIGFDFVFIEGEHFPYTNESLQEIVCACENRNIEPFFRLNNKDASHIMQCLDIGVKGLFCPHVDSGIEAQEIVKAGKFPPQGSRGYSNTSRATNFGYLSMDEYNGSQMKTQCFLRLSRARRQLTTFEISSIPGLMVCIWGRETFLNHWAALLIQAWFNHK